MASAAHSSERLSDMGAALAVPNFRRYVGGQSLSLIGTWMETVAQGLLVLRLTHSAVVLGLTTATRYGPILVLSPYAGLLVDRLPKRRILLVTQVGLGVVSLLLAWPSSRRLSSCGKCSSSLWRSGPSAPSITRPDRPSSPRCLIAGGERLPGHFASSMVPLVWTGWRLC
jgi:MFS family permease